MNWISSTLLVIATVLTPTLSRAASIDVIERSGFNIVRITGEIARGDGVAFQRVLAKAQPIMEVWLASPGGNLEAGMEIGRIIRDARLATRVPNSSECASACFHAFVGGMVRSVDPGARIGVHMASVAFNERFNAGLTDILINSRRMSLEDRIAAITLIVERTSAISAGRQAVHFIGMGVSPRVIDKVFQTSHLGIYWFTNRDLSDFNVVNAVRSR